MSESEPKKETVRITLPPRPTVGESGTPPVKKETVRINLPTRPTLGSASSGAEGAKKESSKLSNLAKPPVLTPRPATAPPPPSAPGGLRPPPGKLTPPAAPAAVGAPAAPAVPRPPAVPPRPPTPAGGAPAAPTAPRPAAPAAPAVPVAKAPSVTGTPAVPRPSAAPAAPAATPADAGDAPAAAAVKPTVKKDTVRIEVPTAKSVPQATVRLQQTQPMIRPPAAEVRPAALVTTSAGASEDVVAENDPMMMIASVCVLVFALVTFGVQLMTYLAN